MADAENMPDTPIQKNAKITVTVEESLPDILVVTYVCGSKIFQGVLLDSTKRNLPYGVTSLNPIYANDKPEGVDRLFSANQRFTYQEGVPSTLAKDFTQKGSVRLPTRYKNTKMTVRLRPRQVLCTKCRGICTENSENVDASRKRKVTAVTEPAPVRPTEAQQKRGPGTIVTRSSRPLSSDNNSQCNEQQCQQQQILKQRMCLRLTPIMLPITEAEPVSDVEERRDAKQEFKEPTVRKDTKGKKMVLRKKKSAENAEELGDKNKAAAREENDAAVVVGASGADSSSNASTSSTRTIKISFGREGEGTVLKIPAKLDNPTEHNAMLSVKARTKGTTSKAARRALKKAKKEARRKILLGSGSSPCYALGSASPRYTLAGNGSPRYMIGSPRHTLGGNSPRYAVTAALPNYDNFPRRHKHKVKHKKKHREDRRAQRDSEAVPIPMPNESYTEIIKERCLKQKLSIHLKRLNASAYTSNNVCALDSSADDDDELMKTDAGSEYSSDEHNENAPDFPPQPITMHITAKMVDNLGEFSIGDIVWGKIHGFPWWPAKVLSMTQAWPDAPAQAYVAWYGSTTSSLMPCNKLSPFLENFQIRYNKKKKGYYKKAIEEATCAAGLIFPPALQIPAVDDAPALATCSTLEAFPVAVAPLQPPAKVFAGHATSSSGITT